MRKEDNKLDFTGQDIYIGIDIGKKVTVAHEVYNIIFCLTFNIRERITGFLMSLI